MATIAQPTDLRWQHATVRIAVIAVLALAFVGVVVRPAQSAPTLPTFVQQASGHGRTMTTLGVTPTGPVTRGNRIVVEVGIWSSARAVTTAVGDSAGNSYTELVHFLAADGTELSVWSAVVAAGEGTRPTVSVTAGSAADLGAVVLEYAGMAADPPVVDVSAQATGKTGAAATVASGPTAPTSTDAGLALGFYADSGFGATLTAGAGFLARANVSPASDMQLLVEERAVGVGAVPSAAAGTGPQTVWLMATLVFLPGPGTPTDPTVPAAPTGVAATAGNTTASVTWQPAGTGGSPLTAYTVTPYTGGVAGTPQQVTGSPPATNAAVTGLVNGTPYTFVVAATNGVGTGPPSAPSPPVTPGPSPGGRWSPLQNWPIVALSSILMKNGKLLTWDGWQQPQPSVVWDPSDPQTFTTTDAPTSVFCDGAAALPDGRILVAGGFGRLTTGALGLADTNIYDPATATWSRVADMHSPRWYPDLTELGDGRYVAISGNTSDGFHWADTPEVYDPAANTWTELTGVSTAGVHEEEYPFSYLAPNGKIFTIGTSEDASYFLDVAARTWTSVGGPSGVRNGSSIMYRPGQVLYTGGAADIRTATSQSTSAVIDLTAATPAWRPTTPMTNARTYHNLTMLADGTVLAVGGAATSDQQVITTGVLPTEIWDPATTRWTSAAPIAAARNYHSTSVLMPDATVLVAGGGHPESLGNPGQASAQTYSPPYLFNGPRPTITAAPGTAAYGSTLAVSTPDAASIASVNLVSLGADTHQADMSQHFVPLTFRAGAGGLTVDAPTSAALAPPGYYMMFVVNGAGVPSVAAMVQLGRSGPVAPTAPTAVTGVPGDRSATVSWTSAGDGGAPVTAYRVSAYTGGAVVASTTVGGTPAPTTATVAGLTNGTSYTFTVNATNVVGSSPESLPSPATIPAAPTVPGVPGAVSAVGGNGSAAVSWTAPATGGSPVRTYTVTTEGPAAPAPVVVAGSPPATSTVIPGLTNGATYRFTVTATNGVGTGPPGTSNVVTPAAVAAPAFVQQVDNHGAGTATRSVTLPAAVTAGNRLVVQVGVWSSAGATATGVSDSAGNTYVRLSRVVATDRTEMTVWSAPVSAGGRPVVSATTTGSADIGVVAAEYAGLSGAPDTSVVDQQASTTGTTGAAATVSSGSTPPTTVAGGIAIGLYADSGFGRSLTAGSGYAARANVSPAPDMELLLEDAPVGVGASPAAGVGTGASTTWLMTTLVLRPAATTAPTVPAAPTGVVAVAGDRSATVTWTAPANGGSAILGYTVTPLLGGAALPATLVTYVCQVSSPMMMQLTAVVPATSAVVTGLANGSAYTFTVTASNTVGTGPPSSSSNSVVPRAPSPPGAPTSVVAVPGDSAATLTWGAPPSADSVISSYTVTPYVGGVPQPVTTVTGAPPATTVRIGGLSNGTAYTFGVTATNAAGAGPAGVSGPVTPTAPAITFVQQAAAQFANKLKVTVVPAATISGGNRLVVTAVVASSIRSVATSVADSAGNRYVEVTHLAGSDGTELSVWTAPITRGSGTRPTVTVTASGRADLGASVTEYAGLSTAADATAVEVTATATGTTGAAQQVGTAPTVATTGAGLVIGAYGDGGATTRLLGGGGYTVRTNASPFATVDLLVEDRPGAPGATPAATAGTGAGTVWVMSTVVFRAR